jgi:glycine cleavage system H protein
MVALAIVGIILGFLGLDMLIQRLSPATALTSQQTRQQVGLPERNGRLTGFRMPRDCSFHPGHTWTKSGKPDDTRSHASPIRVGADDFALSILGRIDAIRVPSSGTELQSGEPIFTLVQNGKEIAFPSPVNGRIAGINKEIVEQPDRISQEPYNLGWICEVEPSPDSLPRQATAQADVASSWWVKDVRRFREYLADLVSNETELGATLADGGAPRTGVLEEFDQQVWTRFQAMFLRQAGAEEVTA